ncbi:MAG: methyltransferase domain-containing protein [Nanoarchaeota archaeon]|nr:methyltransferase domain-containing protein [Nanoarchaeota archaeon]MBU4124029.1 methyltransferase domain-containing protein [Nanoarchaeota archaeon]
MNIIDFLHKAKRGPQVILPKDAGLIISETGLNPTWKVIDAGSGSGFLAMILGNIGCKVFTYEIREDFYNIAKQNIKNSGMNNIKIYNKDITKGIKEKKVDLITLDMKGPERAIKNAYLALKPGGFIVVYSMHIEEVLNVLKELRKYNFHINILENIQREWQSFGDATRPKTHLAHTGFLTFARKNKIILTQ